MFRSIRSSFGTPFNQSPPGCILKVRDSAYASGRGNNWVKTTCAQRETLTIAGFALDEGK
jgi:ATP-dependent DNA ligase